MQGIIYSTAIAASTYIAYKSYKLLHVPKEIQHIPRISYFKFLLTLLSGKPFDVQYEQLYKPTLNKLGYARLWMGGYWEIFFTKPNHAYEILGNHEAFIKQPEGGEFIKKGMLAFEFFGNNNIASTDGDNWRRHRRIANPAFKKTWSNEIFGTSVSEVIEKLTETNQEPIVVQSLFQKLTLDVLGRGLFSYDFKAVRKGESSYYLKIYNEVMKALFNPLYFMFPFLEYCIPSRNYFHDKSKEFRAFLLEIIKERQNELKCGIEKDDLLSLIIKSSMCEIDENIRLTDEEVLNNLVSFFLAGHDTTANTLTSTFYFLAKHQDIQEKARQEVLSLVGNSNSVVIPTSEQTKLLEYINCIIKESMRCLTTASLIRRYCKTETTLSDGLVIPSGCFVTINSWALHHDPDIFPDPHKFNPDRFLDVHGHQDKTWMAFGTGSRMCLGLNFSLIEQRVAMSMLLQKFHIIPGPKSSKQEHPTLNASGLLHPVDMDVCFIPRI